MYQQIKQDLRVKLAIPYAVGDNYQDYRLVGATREIFIDCSPFDRGRLQA